MIKFAIIGFGHIGRRHAAHIGNNKATQLVAVCDINTDIVDELPDKEISFYPKVEDLLSATTADVICICTPITCTPNIPSLRFMRGNMWWWKSRWQ